MPAVFQKVKDELKPKKYINYNNDTETIECDNVMKSEDIEDATFMYEDPSKLKVVADNIRMKSPYKIYMNWVKINLRRRLTLFRFVLCFLRSSWAGQVFSSTSKTEKKKKKKGKKEDQCNYKSISRKHLNNHIDKTHSGNTFLCTWCDRAFAEMRCLRFHTRFVHDMIKFPCNKCTFRVTIQGDLQRHIPWIHEGKRFQCQFCDNRPLRNQRWQRTLNWYMGGQLTKYKKKQNIPVFVFSVESPTLPNRDLINTWCFTRGKIVLVVKTMIRPLPWIFFQQHTHIHILQEYK